MKISKIVKFFIFSLTLMTVPTIQAADESSFTLAMTKKEPSKQEGSETNKGHRSNSHRVTCIINRTDGITMPYIDALEIDAYEIYDINNNLIGSYLTEEDFINHLFILSGDVTIQFVSQDFTLTGEVDLGN